MFLPTITANWKKRITAIQEAKIIVKQTGSKTLECFIQASFFVVIYNFIQSEFGCLPRVAGPNEPGLIPVRWDTLVFPTASSCTFEWADLQTVLNPLVVVPVCPDDVCYLVLLQEGRDYLRVADSI